MCDHLLKNLRQDSRGIWQQTQASPIAYPEDGHSKCFYLEDSSFWFTHRNNAILSAIKRFPPGGMIMDLGGGNGFVTRRLLDEGFDALLLEPGHQGCLHAKVQRGIPLVVCSTLENAKIPTSSIDAIGMFDVFEHVADEKNMMNLVSNTLKPGGRIYLTVPAHQWLWSGSDDRAMHFRRYNHSRIREMMGDHFKLIYFTYFFAALILPVFLLRALPYRVLPSKKNVLSSESEHGTGQGCLSRFLGSRLKGEVKRISRGESMPIGTSCLVVAKKI